MRLRNHMTVYCILYFNDECVIPRKNTLLKGDFNKTKPYESLSITIVPRAIIEAYFYFILHLQDKMLKDLIST